MTQTFELTNGVFVTVRPLAPGDGPALQRFDRGLSARSRDFFLPHMYDDATVAKAIARSQQGDDAVFLALDAEEIVAYFFLWYARRRVCLLGIGITDAYHGLGLGRQAMAMLIAEGRRAGAEGIELTTALDNDRAFALYQRMGFSYLRDVDNVVGDGSIKVERCMFLPLTPGAEPMTEPHAPPV